MVKDKAVFKELPLSVVDRDSEQPRKDFGVLGDENRICESIRRYGIGNPIAVVSVGPDRYKIIDGHRRYIAATKIGMTTVPCRIYDKLTDGELETLRYELQNNRRNWKPLEKSNSLARIKSYFNLRTNRELAERLNLSITMVANSLQLREQKLEYTELMESYQLKNSYRIEFVRIKPKLQKVKEFEIDDIVKIIFDKIKADVIRSARDLRVLGKIFLRTNANSTELHKFLSDMDMTVSELEQRTLQSGFSLHIEQAITAVTSKRRDGIAFSTKEKALLNQLHTLLNKVL